MLGAGLVLIKNLDETGPFEAQPKARAASLHEAREGEPRRRTLATSFRPGFVRRQHKTRDKHPGECTLRPNHTRPRSGGEIGYEQPKLGPEGKMVMRSRSSGRPE